MSGVEPNEENGLSQEDIDAALAAGADADGAQEGAAEDGAVEDGDAADTSASGASFSEEQPVADGESPGAEAVADEQAESSPPAAESGGLSQADIDAALAGADPPESAEAAESAMPQESPKLDSAGRPFDEAAAMMEAAIAEERAAAEAAAASSPALQAEPPPMPAGAAPLDMPDFGAGAEDAISHKGIELLNNVDLDVKIELGRAELLIEDVLKLGEGSVVELDKLAGDPVDMLVNDRLVARGEVIVLNDNFCVRISEIVAPQSGWEAA
ncbi:MAG: flagellar motor switch protein FliN [Planctomycetota bacterium]